MAPGGAESTPREIAYGTPLRELAERYWFLGDFLEAAAVAGHTSAIFEGLAMTIRAYHAWAVAEARADVIQGVDGDARSLLDGGAYRQVIMLLEEKVADLEERAADVHRAIPADWRFGLRRAARRSALYCEPGRGGRAGALRWPARTPRHMAPGLRRSSLANLCVTGGFERAGPYGR